VFIWLTSRLFTGGFRCVQQSVLQPFEYSNLAGLQSYGNYKSDIETLLTLQHRMPVLDVRSPSEYQHAHILSILIPLFFLMKKESC
jgi:hypothetical protein